jgi:hypothetical protein
MREPANLQGSRTFVIWGAALLAALWLAGTAIGGIAQDKAPGIALAVYPPSGFAYESRASLSTAGADVSIQKMRVSDGELADAIAAVRREPFATAALTLIGLSRDRKGAHADAATIIGSAHALDKRQLVANAWLINHYGTTGRGAEVLRLLDEALKVRPQLSSRYMPAFAQALQNPETLPAFQTLLRNRPDWEPNFWDAVTANPGALANAEVLRARMLSGPQSLGDTDRKLMAAYIAAGRMDLALRSGKILAVASEDRDNMIRNASFAEMPQLPPLDWELRNDGRIGAAIDEGLGTLEVSALPGSGGTVARQLIALPPGTYSLLVKLGQAEVSKGSEISVHLHCAEGGAADASMTERLSGDLDRRFVVPDGGCRFYWVDIDFSALGSSESALATLAEVRIARGRPPPQE